MILSITLSRKYGTVRRRASTGPSGEGRKGPLLPTAADYASSFGVPALPGSRMGGTGRTQAPCGLAPDPLFGGPTCSIGYPGQTGHLNCILRGGKISARSPGGMGSSPDIRGYELSAAACIRVYLAGQQARFCARIPASRGPDKMDHAPPTSWARRGT